MEDKKVKLVVPAHRMKHVDEVFEERLGDLLKNFLPDKLVGTTSLVKWLVQNTEAWNELSKWREEVRAEAHRRYEASDDYRRLNR